MSTTIGSFCHHCGGTNRVRSLPLVPPLRSGGRPSVHRISPGASRRGEVIMVVECGSCDFEHARGDAGEVLRVEG